MKIISVFLIISIIFTSCTSVTLVKYKQSEYDKLNKEIEGEEVHIIKRNDHVLKAYDVKVAIDSITVSDFQHNKIFSLPTATIKEITYESSLDGAEEGFMYGFLYGVGSAIFIFAVEGIEDSPFFLGVSLIFGVIGAVLGFPIGAAIGQTDRYILQAPPDSISVQEYNTNHNK
jgi:hypothetical protein